MNKEKILQDYFKWEKTFNQKGALFLKTFKTLKAETAPTKPLITFYLGQEWYGLEINTLKEIIGIPPITFVPHVPDYVAGIIHYRGEILPLVILKKYIGFADNSYSDKALILVIENKNDKIGLIIDKLAHILEVPLNKIFSPTASLESRVINLLEGETEMDGQLLTIINTHHILGGLNHD